MTKERVAKIDDYLAHFEALESASGVPIGAVIFAEPDRQDVAARIKDKNIASFNLDSAHPDTVIKGLALALGAGKGTVLEIQTDLPGKIINQLSSLVNRRIHAVLAGQSEPLVIDPVPQGGFVLLLMSEEKYNDLVLGDIVSSYCRLV